MYVFVHLCRCLVCVCVRGLLKLRTLRFCLLNNYFTLICAIFTGIHNSQLCLHWTIRSDRWRWRRRGRNWFSIWFCSSQTHRRARTFTSLLIHFNLQSLAPLEYLCNCETRVENGGKLLKSVLKRGRCACMLLSLFSLPLHLYVGYARVCHKITVRAAQANNHVRSQRVFLAFWESMHMCVFVSVGCVVSFAGALSCTQPNATARTH